MSDDVKIQIKKIKNKKYIICPKCRQKVYFPITHAIEGCKTPFYDHIDFDDLKKFPLINLTYKSAIIEEEKEKKNE